MIAASQKHWAEKYIGLPWANGAAGPDRFDCWGLVRWIYQSELGIKLDAVEVDAEQVTAIRSAIADEQRLSGRVWTPLPDPALMHSADYDVILLSQAAEPDHVGLWVGGALLHCVRRAGVVYQTAQSLRRSGWRILAGYRHKALEPSV